MTASADFYFIFISFCLKYMTDIASNSTEKEIHVLQVTLEHLSSQIEAKYHWQEKELLLIL